MGELAVISAEELEARLSAAVARALEPVRAELQRLRTERSAAPVTMREAARRLGVSLRTVERRVRAGELQAKRTGRAVRVIRPAEE